MVEENKYIKKLTISKVPLEWKVAKLEHGKEWKEILGLGILAIKENPQLIERIREVEKKIERYEMLINTQYETNIKVRKDIKELQNNMNI